MRGTRKKLLLGPGKSGATGRAVKKIYMERNPGWATAKPWGPDGGLPTYGETWAFQAAHPTHELSRPAVFDDLSDKGKGRVLNLMSGRKNRFGYPVFGTGRASRLSKPALAAVIADILARHLDVQQFGRTR